MTARISVELLEKLAADWRTRDGEVVTADTVYSWCASELEQLIGEQRRRSRNPPTVWRGKIIFAQKVNRLEDALYRIIQVADQGSRVEMIAHEGLNPLPAPASTN